MKMWRIESERESVNFLIKILLFLLSSWFWCWPVWWDRHAIDQITRDGGKSRASSIRSISPTLLSELYLY